MHETKELYNWFLDQFDPSNFYTNAKNYSRINRCVLASNVCQKMQKYDDNPAAFPTAVIFSSVVLHASNLCYERKIPRGVLPMFEIYGKKALLPVVLLVAADRVRERMRYS